MEETEPKSKHDGSITKARKKEIDSKLKELYFQDGITYSHAADIAGCSRKYSSLKFKYFGDEIQKHKEPDDTWIDKNDRVRDRALEGLSKQIKKSDTAIERLEQDLKKEKQVKDAIIPNLAQKIEDSEIGAVILEAVKDKTIKWPHVMQLQTILNNDLNLYKNFGYYTTTIEEKIRGERTFQAELQMQYDTIEILPPPSEILQAELERRIAAKQNLKPAVPIQEVPKEKPKRKSKK